MRLRGSRVAVCCAMLMLAGAADAIAFDPLYEQSNYAKINERYAQVVGQPAYQALLRQKGVEKEAEAAQILASDGPPAGRDFTAHLCWQHMDGCAGDVRFYDWAARGSGVVKPILFTARNGSTLSGHLWATKAGPAKRPGVVITNGSVQAPEELYWSVAQTLAKAGYVVMTFDPQGQGYSDDPGQGADRDDGVPSQAGQPFYDGTEDALDFFFSDASRPYVPRKSCSSGTSHADRQAERVKAGLNSASNPMAELLDATRVGLVGHSLGAAGVSYVAQLDPRVRAVVAYDNLAAPAGKAPFTCPSGSSPRPVPGLTKPALGLSADYGLTPMPNTGDPDPLAKSAASLAFSKAGVDTGELVIRGGTHYEFSFIPNPGFGATLRGNDLTAFYTRAWLDKYVAGGAGAADADRRLMTDRWRRDAPGAAVDANKDGNLFSTYYRSRLDITRAAGGRFTCEDLRAAACGLARDGDPEPYDVLAAASTPDAPTGPPGTGGASSQAGAGAPGAPPASSGPAAAPPAGRPAPCRDATAPTAAVARNALHVSRDGLRVTGRAADRGCGGATGRVVRVQVALARVAGSRCRFLRESGRLGPTTSCRRTVLLGTSGTTRWSLRRRAPLPRGRYRLYVRAVDAAGNAGRPVSPLRRNRAVLR